MKKKLFATAVLALLAVFSISGCTNSASSEHDHVWDNGEVTTVPTCHSEGLKTYKCTVKGCKQTKTESLAMTAHNWDEGRVTTPPTCSSTGVKTITCQNEGCGQTKTVVLDKLEHQFNDGELSKIPDLLVDGELEQVCSLCGEHHKELVEARADFEEQFGRDSNWAYAYLDSFNATQTSLTLKKLNKDGGTYKNENVKFEKGSVSANGVAVLGYIFTQDENDLSVNAKASFVGKEETTILNAYLVLIDSEGTVKKTTTIPSEIKEWNFATEHEIEVNKGDVLCLVLNNGGTGSPEGQLHFTVKAKCVHVWDEGEVTKPATCKEEGERTYTCKICGNTHVDPIAKTDHTWDEGKVTTEPTETTYGVMTYTCTVCGQTDERQIAKLPHEIGNYASSFSTTQENGWVYGASNITKWEADDFGFEFAPIPRESDEAFNNHNGIEIKSDWIKNEEGGKQATVGFKVPEGNASLSIHIGFVGSNEDETRMAMRVVVADSNNKSKSVEFIADGQETYSWSKDLKVDVAGGDIVYFMLFNEGLGYHHGNISINIKGTEGEPFVPCIHVWDAGVVTKEPTYEETGVRTYTCTECGTTREEILPKLLPVIANFKESFSTIENNGWLYGASNVLTWGGDDGFTFGYTSLQRENDEIWNSFNGIEIKAGWIRNEEAGKQVTVGYVVPEGNDHLHLNVEFKGENELETNLSMRVVVTSNLGSNANEAIFVNKGTVNWTEELEVNVSTGDIVYFMFFNEGAGYHKGDLDITIKGESGEVFTPCTHEWGSEITTQPSCTGEGVRTYTCSKCGSQYEEVVAALGHDYHGQVTTNPTCTKDGVETFTCSRCGDHYDEPVDALGHTWDGGVVTKDPTLTELGEMTYTCTVCGATRVESIPTLTPCDPDAHVWDAGVVTDEPTCTETGTKKYTCTVCGTTKEESVPASGHSMSAYVVTTEPTESADGVRTSTCSVCGHEDTKSIGAIHEIGNFRDSFYTGGGNGWLYGYATDFNFETGDFKFNSLSKVSEEEMGGVSGFIVKRDWLLTEGAGDLAIGYEVPDGNDRLKIDINFVGRGDALDETRLHARLIVTDSSNKAKQCIFIGAGQDNMSWDATNYVDVANGDKVYVVLFNTGSHGWRQGDIQISIKGQAGEVYMPYLKLNNGVATNRDGRGTFNLYNSDFEAKLVVNAAEPGDSWKDGIFVNTGVEAGTYRIKFTVSDPDSLAKYNVIFLDEQFGNKYEDNLQCKYEQEGTVEVDVEITVEAGKQLWIFIEAGFGNHTVLIKNIQITPVV